MTGAELWERLQADGAVEGERPEAGRPSSPWYVRAMLGIAGWIGALFLLGFVGTALAFLVNDTAIAIVIGAACCAAAFTLFRIFDGNDFAEQFALAISLVGQVLLIIGYTEFLQVGDAVFYLAIAVTQAGLALAVPNFLHRVLASGGAAIALGLAIHQMSLHGLAAPLLCAGLALVWLDPKLWAGRGALWRPVGYGLVLALLLIETFRLFGAEYLLGLGKEKAGWLALYGPLLGRSLTAAVLVWVAAALSRREGFAAASPTSLAAAGGAILFGLLSLMAPGLASATLIVLLGFAAGNRLLAALGILSLLGFVAHFYYSLHASLLAKSGILAVTGLCLLAAHFALARRSKATEAGHA
jgi:hypothetical protein